jgi:AraC-like DNA-binding protein
VADPPAPSPVRDRARCRATAWIEESLEMAPNVIDLSTALGVSRWTLEYAFREHFGELLSQTLAL